MNWSSENEWKKKQKSRGKRKKLNGDPKSDLMSSIRTKDLRSGHETGNVQAVLDGDLNDFIKSYLMEFAGK